MFEVSRSYLLHSIIVFKFCGVCGNFLQGDAGIEPAVDSVFLDFPHDAFVGIVLLVFLTIGVDLKTHVLDQSLHFLFVHHLAPVL